MSDLVKNNNIYDPIYGGTFNPNYGVYNPREINQAVSNMVPDDIKEWWKNGKFTDIFPLIWNKGMRMYQQHNADKEPVSTAVMPSYSNTEQYEGKYPSTWFSKDTIQLEYRPDQYVLAGSVNLSDTKFGVHNGLRNNVKQYRDDGSEYTGDAEDIAYRSIRTPGMIVTTLRPFVPYSVFLKNGKSVQSGYRLMGVDKYGNVKFENFQPNDFVTEMPITKNVLGFKRDKNNDFIEAFPRGNHPGKLLDIAGPTNKDWPARFVIGKNVPKNTYGHTTGGACIVKVDDEVRIPLGSLEQIDAVIQDMRRRHQGKPVDIYRFDLGSFSTGLRTYSGVISPETWEQYNGFNVAGGHGLYILPEDEAKIRAQQEKSDKLKETIDYYNQYSPSNLSKKQNNNILKPGITYEEYKNSMLGLKPNTKKEPSFNKNNTTKLQKRTSDKRDTSQKTNLFTITNNVVDSIKSRIKAASVSKPSTSKLVVNKSKPLSNKVNNKTNNTQSTRTHTLKPKKNQQQKNKIKISEKRPRYNYNNPLYTI